VIKGKWKKAGAITGGLLLLPILLALFLYYNRHQFIPEVEKITYLRADFSKGKAVINAGIKVRNLAFFSLQVDSVKYQILSKGEILGFGKHAAAETLPALKAKELDFRLYLNTTKFRQYLAQQQNKEDSLELEVLLQVFLNPPLLSNQTVTLKRKLKIPLNQSPAIKIDTFFVKSFSPKEGYSFQLNLKTGKTNLPDLQIKNLTYSLQLSDSILVSGKIDSTIGLNNNSHTIAVPILIKTTDLMGILLSKPGSPTNRPYEAKATASLVTGHQLINNTPIIVTKTGNLDIRKLGSSSLSMPSVKKIRSLELIPKDKQFYLQAELLVNNPTRLPLYIDKARYFVRHKGKIIASGSNEFKKILPANGNRSLNLQLVVNKLQFQRLSADSVERKDIPLDVELLLDYDRTSSKHQQFSVKKTIHYSVTSSPTFEFSDILIKELDPEKGAHLLVKLKVNNKGGTRMLLDDLKYNLLLKNKISLTGQINKPFSIEGNTSEIEIPVNLSGSDLSLVAKNLVQGVESWDYTFNGSAFVSVPNTLLQRTEVTINTKGIYNINSKGTPDYMPEISKIDTLNLTIRYDTAWVNMYAAIYNTLPATIHISQLQVDVLHKNDTIGKTEEKLDIFLTPNANTFAWHTLGLNYGLWEEHVKNNAGQDSMLLNLPVSLMFSLGNLGDQQATLDLSTKIPTPGAPTTMLQRLKLKGFGFGSGLKFMALISIQNANSEGLTIKNINYQVKLENGVNISGKLDETYSIPIGKSEVQIPVNLSVWEALKLFTRQLFGPSDIDYKLSATAQVHTANPKLNDVFVIFENQDKSNMRRNKPAETAK
jgi:LEA14-like dessication related protein